ncbi:hypothetical protein HPB47_010313 [Ixodes persulcatus]|uniref:Uncharacterized protein n=1 Tax=Ixodes persulcatus TaxID=34615 RepID=A0AC60NZI0_IXOPE|nr:hypothetical protein HPB47_010313 [Ixodes persulcatus]
MHNACLECRDTCEGPLHIKNDGPADDGADSDSSESGLSSSDKDDAPSAARDKARGKEKKKDFIMLSRNDSLYLTPYIEQERIQEALTESRVGLFKNKVGAEAYSGYITVNKEYDSNLFFLYIRAKSNPSDAPLLLWLQGGPGLSSLFGQFLEIGPLAIDGKGKTFPRKPTLQKNMNMIFLDQPVGSGYSYTKSQNGYAKNLDDVSTGITEFLKQFLKMFPEFTGRDFYIGGESYGARFAVGITHSLFTANNPEISLNVKGLICGAGFLGPLLEVADSHEFLYEVSMLTSEGRDEFASRFELIRTLAATNQTAALLLLLQTVFTSDTNPTLFQQLTGYDNQASALYATKPANMLAYERYVQTKEFKKAVHVGDSIVFQKDMFTLMFGLLQDYLANIDAEIEELLDTYKVLFYYGQMDSLFPAVHQKAFTRSLNWTGSDVFRNANRQTWRADDSAVKLLGYKTTAAQFTEVVLLKAGHYAAVDEPIGDLLYDE